MSKFFRTASAALCLTVSTLALPNFAAAEAITRGGTMVYGRYADSQFLDPVLAQVNVDIWILSNLYDTLLLPTEDGKAVQPGIASAWMGGKGQRWEHN